MPTTAATRLCVDCLLHMRINLNHVSVQIRMITNHDLGVPSSGNEDSVDTATKRSGEDVADLQTDDEGEGYHDGRIPPRLVICRLSEDQVQVGQEGAGIGDEGGSHAEDGADEAFVDEGIDATIFDHSRC